MLFYPLKPTYILKNSKILQIFLTLTSFFPCVFFTFSQIKQIFVFWPTALHTRERPGGEFWGVCVDLSVTAGFRCPSDL